MSVDERMDTSSGQDPYESFRVLLQQSIKFPSKYTFKFIVKAEEDKIEALHAIFANKNAHITANNSSTGKYRSFTVVIKVKDEEEVISYYREVSRIDSVIML